MTDSVRTIPALINIASGNADEARKALTANDAFEVREVSPHNLEAALRDALVDGESRILVAGGDGTIATAAAALVKTETELAILPTGTLNHFARDLGIPSAPAEALALAAIGTSRQVDVGMVNERVFLNTSSVGAYVHFVRVREYTEPRFGYAIASCIAAFRMMLQLRLVAVEIEVDGESRIYRTPMVFIGVGERELQLPKLGKRVPKGKRGLHIMVVRGRSRGAMLAMGLNAVARGVETASRTPELDSFIVDKCSITLYRNGMIAADGELVRLGQSLQYRLERDALRVVCP